MKLQVSVFYGRGDWSQAELNCNLSYVRNFKGVLVHKNQMSVVEKQINCYNNYETHAANKYI